MIGLEFMPLLAGLTPVASSIWSVPGSNRRLLIVVFVPIRQVFNLTVNSAGGPLLIGKYKENTEYARESRILLY